MVVTDLDGTLLGMGGILSTRNLRTLEFLGVQGIVRVVATGRNLYSVKEALPPTFPIDFLIFSSGGGILDWQSQQLLLSHHLNSEEALSASHILVKQNLDFMIHGPIPDNHHFVYHRSNTTNPDFDRRLLRYAEFCGAWIPPQLPFLRVSQLLAIVRPEEGESTWRKLTGVLPEFNIIRTTSPMDHASAWIEIFPKSVSKSIAALWLLEHSEKDPSSVVVLGNDYNDRDLLEWGAVRFVVKNAPEELRRTFPVVGSNDEDGFSEAIERWLSHHRPSHLRTTQKM